MPDNGDKGSQDNDAVKIGIKHESVPFLLEAFFALEIIIETFYMLKKILLIS